MKLSKYNTGCAMRAQPLALIVLAGLVSQAVSMYTAEDAVLTVTSDDFDSKILNVSGPALVEFFSPGCGHCKALVPEYKKVARNLQGLATVAAVDCADEASRKICQRYQIRGFPTLKVFKPDIKVNPYTGDPMKEEVAYEGARSARAMSEAVTDTLHDQLISRLGSKEELEGLQKKKPALATVLLFTNKQQSTVLYKALSLAYAGRLRFAEVRPVAEDLVQQYGVDSYPTLVVVKEDGSKQVYDGVLKAVPMREFLDTFAAAAPVAAAAAGGKDTPEFSDGSKESQVPGLLPEVHLLKPENLTAIDAQEGMWLIGFYSTAGGACEAQVAAATKLLEEVQEVVSLGLLDTATAADTGVLRSYGLDVAALQGEASCNMQWVLFPAGADKQDQEQYQRYEGPVDAKSLQKWVLDEVSDSTVLLSSMSELQQFASIGLGPTEAANGKPVGKVLLLASKQEVPGVYKALAQQLGGKARLMFAWVQPGTPFAEQAMKQFKAKRVPALAALVPPPPGALSEADRKEAAKKSTVPVSVQPYWGPLKFQHMRMWLVGLAAMTGLADGPLPGFPDGPATTGSDELVHQISSQKDLEQHCIGKGGICVLGLAASNTTTSTSDSDSDSDGDSDSGSSGSSTQGLQKLLRGVAVKFLEQPMQFGVLNASAQPTLCQLLGLGSASEAAQSLPAVVALSVKRMRYVVLPAPLTVEAVGKSLDKVLDGTANTSPLQGTPAYVDGGERLEAPTEPEEPVEEEFDLSDIMSEEVSGGLLSKEEQLKKIEEELAAEAAAAKASSTSAGKKKKKKSKKNKKQKQKKSAAKEEL